MDVPSIAGLRRGTPCSWHGPHLVRPRAPRRCCAARYGRRHGARPVHSSPSRKTPGRAPRRRSVRGALATVRPAPKRGSVTRPVKRTQGAAQHPLGMNPFATLPLTGLQERESPGTTPSQVMIPTTPALSRMAMSTPHPRSRRFRLQNGATPRRAGRRVRPASEETPPCTVAPLKPPCPVPPRRPARPRDAAHAAPPHRSGQRSAPSPRSRCSARPPSPQPPTPP